MDPGRDDFVPQLATSGALRVAAIESEWRSLAGSTAGALFRGPDWLLPWWHAYHNTLGAELHVLVGRATDADATTAAGDIVCIAPLYRRTVKVALLDTRELRMIGDAGPRPPALPAEGPPPCRRRPRLRASRISRRSRNRPS